MFSPAITNFLTATSKNNLSSWPGLATKLINKHLPKLVCTYQDHMHKEYQGFQSTKANNLSDQMQDSFPMSDIPNVKTNNVCFVLLNPQEIATGYLDLTGRFPRRSSRGN